jgi:glutathione S-transferase
MPRYRLYIFDYNYSSWSMRAGIVLRAAGVPFEEQRINLDDDGRAHSKQLSPSGLLPMLEHDELRVCDSLAIAEYMAERCPDAGLWPSDPSSRALARAASAEMHSGFQALRNVMNMNIRARYPGFARAPEVDGQVSRIKQLWADLRARHASQGDFLCGRFGIVDAMFAPVVTRFRTYDVKLTGVARAYSDAVFAHPAMTGWLAEAEKDTFVVPAYEYVTG